MVPPGEEESGLHSIAEVLEMRAGAHGDRQLLATGNAERTYADVAGEAAALRSELADRGLGAGDHVAIVASNRDDFLSATLAVLGLGAVLIPVNPALTKRELRHILTDSRAAAAFVEPSTCAAVQEILHEGVGGHTVLDLDSMGRDPSGAPAVATAGPRDLAALLYTSGTTAEPKGVMVPQAGFCAAPLTRARALGWDERERVLVVNPLFHVNGLVQSCFAAIGAGASIVLRSRFSASAFWDDVRESAVTTTCGMQTIPRILLAREERPDDADNPLATMVGVLPPGLFERFEERFGVALVPAYSLTEDTMSVLNVGIDGPRRVQAAGRPTGGSDHRVVIVDEAGRHLGASQVGEIVKRSPATMLGYYGRPSETREALRDGWLHTGDAGFVDEDGLLYFVDRIKDVIRCRGEMVSSAEVESIIALDERVEGVAVVAVPDDVAGEEVKAVVVADAAAEDLIADLWALCEEQLAPFKIPTFIELRDELPRTANLKVRKASLREQGTRGRLFRRDRRRGSDTATTELAVEADPST
jgi:acyl-CoA synthetase (AMP-forming)/AMP-acid ligase II